MYDTSSIHPCSYVQLFKNLHPKIHGCVGNHLLLGLLEACRKAGDTLYRSEFDALSIGSGLVAAALL